MGQTGGQILVIIYSLRLGSAILEKAAKTGIISNLPTSMRIIKRNFGTSGKSGVRIFGESPVVVMAETLSTKPSVRLYP